MSTQAHITTEELINAKTHTAAELLGFRRDLWYIRDGWNRECYTPSSWSRFRHWLLKWL